MADFSLALTWTPATGGEACRYTFALTNRSGAPLSRFSLCWSGHGRLDPDSAIDNGILMRRISNFAEVAAPAGLTLAPGETWTFTAHVKFRAVRHWTDAAQAAFVVETPGKVHAVDVGLCRSTAEPDGEPVLGIDPPAATAKLEQGLALVPWPAEIRAEGEQPVPRGLSLDTGPAAAMAAAHTFTELCATLFPEERLVAAGGHRVRFDTDAALGAEAYRLAIAEDTTTVTATTEAGYLYGLVTLGQILLGASRDPTACRFPRNAWIADAPAMGWRGAHLDVARQFYPVPELRTFLAVMAWNKLNRFHLHLTEDEAWRYEVSAFPDLTRVGAFRGYGLPLPPLLGSGAEAYGGFYTKAELRDLVALGRRYGIEIVPEVDVPGHSFAAVMALPWLRDPGENGEYLSIQGFPNNCLNSAVPRTMRFIETVFEELLDVFPSRWIHVGADEVPDDAWASSPLGRQRLAEIGGGGAHELQADFLKRLHHVLREAGRVTGAWEEAANGGGITPEASYLAAWRDTKVGGDLAARGYDVVMTPGQAYYLDMALSADWWEPGAFWAGTSSVENTYRFDPAAGFAPEHRGRLLGIQACIWSEPMADRRVFHRLVFPRLSAIAETAWTPKARKSWTRFDAAAPFLPTMHG